MQLINRGIFIEAHSPSTVEAAGSGKELERGSIYQSLPRLGAAADRVTYRDYGAIHKGHLQKNGLRSNDVFFIMMFSQTCQLTLFLRTSEWPLTLRPQMSASGRPPRMQTSFMDGPYQRSNCSIIGLSAQILAYLKPLVDLEAAQGADKLIGLLHRHTQGQKCYSYIKSMQTLTRAKASEGYSNSVGTRGKRLVEPICPGRLV